MDETITSLNRMNIKELKNLLSEFGSNVRFEYDLKKNWFNIGGKTKVYYKAENLKELVSFLKKLDNKKKIFILGAGSNTLISDNLFDGVVIKLSKNFNNLSLLNEDIIIAGSSVLDKQLSNFAIQNSLSGFEFLSCIPGTVGGGIKMNAGCFGREFKDILLSIQALDKKGNIITISSKEIKFEYRKNNLPEDLIFLSASFKGKKGKSSEIESETNRLISEKEKINQQKLKLVVALLKIQYLNLKKVWELIKESVPLNQSFGDAYISDKHYNFFVNKGEATFDDMNNLINYVAEKVFKKTGIKLEKEIKILE